MQKITTMALASAVVLFLTVGNVHADENVDKVVAKMAEGDISSICSGGRETITTASTKAVRALAQAGEISGDFKAIGAAAGTTFYKSKC